MSGWYCAGSATRPTSGVGGTGRTQEQYEHQEAYEHQSDPDEYEDQYPSDIAKVRAVVTARADHRQCPSGRSVPSARSRPATGPCRPTERERNDAMAGQKIRIRLKAYDHEVIDSSARKIVDTVVRTGATVAGPVPLPTEKNVFCVIRSPHKYKDSREHFEMRTHKRLIDIINPTPEQGNSRGRFLSRR